MTHYGFIRDSRYFYYQVIEGDFVCEVSVEGNYRDLYNQAGLMLRLDDKTWLKCGVEFVGGVQQANAVVTHDYSDWSFVLIEPWTSLSPTDGVLDWSFW